MRIACANCNAAYDVPPERVPPGKGVKCARCGTVWVPVERVDAAPEIEVTPEPVLKPEATTPPVVTAAVPAPVFPVVEEVETAEALPPAAIAAEPPPPVRSEPGRNRAVLAGWLVSAAILAGLGWAGVHYRDKVIQAWPNAGRAYEVLGLR